MDKTKAREVYEKNLADIVTEIYNSAIRKMKEDPSAVTSALQDAARHVAFDEDKSEKLLHLVKSLGSSIEQSEERFLNDLNGLLSGVSLPVEPSTPAPSGPEKKRKKRSEMREIGSVVKDAIELLATDEAYRKSGISIDDILQVAGLKPIYKGGATIAARKIISSQPGYEIRDRRIYPPAVEAEKGAGTVTPAAPAAAASAQTTEPYVSKQPYADAIDDKYVFPHRLPTLKKLDSLKIIDRLCKHGGVLQLGYKESYGRMKGGTALKQIRKDIKMLMEHAGFRGNPDIEIDFSNRKLYLGKSTCGEFVKIANRRMYA